MEQITMRPTLEYTEKNEYTDSRIGEKLKSLNRKSECIRFVRPENNESFGNFGKITLSKHIEFDEKDHKFKCGYF